MSTTTKRAWCQKCEGMLNNSGKCLVCGEQNPAPKKRADRFNVTFSGQAKRFTLDSYES